MVQLHAGSTQDGSQGASRAALFSDYLTDVLVGDAEADNGGITVVNQLDRHTFGLIDQGADDLNAEGLHMADGALDTLLDFDAQGWQAEIASIGEYLQGYGTHLPEKLRAEQQRVAEALKREAAGSVAPAPKAAAVS
mgnify:CR=1 FL=1